MFIRVIIIGRCAESSVCKIIAPVVETQVSCQVLISREDEQIADLRLYGFAFVGVFLFLKTNLITQHPRQHKDKSFSPSP